MNIQEAKDSIKDAIRAYLGKDAAGMYRMPRSRQRPIMLLGAPGLGKTAIMSQIAAELGLGYVGYTITHHTRQSAIGLPTISTRSFGGRECAFTEYTMSEIVASVHEAIDSQGHEEGILFIDEINCVSETLAPAMLDLLQNKRFGPHPIPDGWILVAAGNPPEFNSSARMFDIATLDRIRVIDVEPDTDVWVRYALSSGIHNAIAYYLRVKPQNLLHIERTVGGYSFVTPRAWEDLSAVLKEYDRMGIEADTVLVSQYVRDADIAAEFARYLGFHRSYSDRHDVARILDAGGDAELREADAEEKMAVISVMIGSINDAASALMDLRRLGEMLSAEDDLDILAQSIRHRLDGNVTSEDRRFLSFGLEELETNRDQSREEILASVARRTAKAEADFDRYLVNGMECLISEFGGGQEPTTLLVGLLGCMDTVMASRPDGPLYDYNDRLLTTGRDRRIERMLEGSA